MNSNVQPYLIDIDGVSLCFPKKGGGSKLVIKQLKLQIRDGEFVTLVGPTGCGKTTLLRMIFGSQLPTTGTVKVDGKIVESIGRDRGIVFQRYSLMPNCSVVQNIALGLELDRANLPQRAMGALFRIGHFTRIRREALDEARELTAKIGLKPEDCDKLPHELSGGMRQRVAIAQALVLRPKVLLMDEPFGALDAGVRKDMQGMLQKWWQEYRMTVIFVTHDLEEALFLGNRVLGLSQLWRDDAGKDGEGALLMTDKLMPGGLMKPHSFKSDPEFRRILDKIGHDVLEPVDKLTPKQFELDHPDAWHPVFGKERRSA